MIIRLQKRSAVWVLLANGFRFVALLLALTLPAHALTYTDQLDQLDVYPPAPAQPVVYRRDMPKAVARMTPKMGKTIFWGRFLPEGSKHYLGVHLIQSTQKRAKQNFDSYGSPFAAYYILDIVGIDNPRHPQLLNRFTAYATVEQGETFDIKFYWLDVEKKTIPLLVIKSSSDSTYGACGTDTYLVFAKGWSGNIRAQYFGFGFWHGSTTCGERNFVIKDGDMLSLHIVTYPDSEDGDLEQNRAMFTAIFKWNGIGFSASPPLTDLQNSIIQIGNLN